MVRQRLMTLRSSKIRFVQAVIACWDVDISFSFKNCTIVFEIFSRKSELLPIRSVQLPERTSILEIQPKVIQV